MAAVEGLPPTDLPPPTHHELKATDVIEPDPALTALAIELRP